MIRKICGSRPKSLVDPKTNELYVADGYGNRRVIVFDAEQVNTSGTGARMGTNPMTRNFLHTTHPSHHHSSSALLFTASLSRVTAYSMSAIAPMIEFKCSRRTVLTSRKHSSQKTPWETVPRSM